MESIEELIKRVKEKLIKKSTSEYWLDEDMDTIASAAYQLGQSNKVVELLAGVGEPFAEVRLNKTGGNAGLSTQIVQLADEYYPAGTKLYTAEAVAAAVAQAVAAEREACADIVDNAYTPDCGGWTAEGIADAIRARKGDAA